MKSRVFYPPIMTRKNEAILQKLDSKLDSKSKKFKNQIGLKLKTPVFTGVSGVARERFELSASGLWILRSNQLSYLAISISQMIWGCKDNRFFISRWHSLQKKIKSNRLISDLRNEQLTFDFHFELPIKTILLITI